MRASVKLSIVRLGGGIRYDFESRRAFGKIRVACVGGGDRNCGHMGRAGFISQSSSSPAKGKGFALKREG